MPSNAETTLPIQTMVSAYARWSAPVQSTESDSQPATVPSSQPSPGLRFATWNVHSLRNKHVVVSAIIPSCGIDLPVATESWHQSSSGVAVRRSTPPGYSAVDLPRPDGSSYGGIVIFHRYHLSVRRIPLASSQTTFEALAVSVSSPRGPLTILAAYRPGSTSPSSLFFHEFAVPLEQFALYNAQLVVTVDLNLHLEDPSLPASSEFHTIIDQFGLIIIIIIFVFQISGCQTAP